MMLGPQVRDCSGPVETDESSRRVLEAASPASGRSSWRSGFSAKSSLALPVSEPTADRSTTPTWQIETRQLGHGSHERQSSAAES